MSAEPYVIYATADTIPPNDFLTPDHTDQSWRDEFTVNVPNLIRNGSIWLTVANLSIRIGMEGHDIVLSTYPIGMENLYSTADGGIDRLRYNVHELEDLRAPNREHINIFSVEPYTPYTLPPITAPNTTP